MQDRAILTVRVVELCAGSSQLGAVIASPHKVASLKWNSLSHAAVCREHTRTCTHTHAHTRAGFKVKCSNRQLSGPPSCVLQLMERLLRRRTRSTSAQGRVGETERPAGLEFVEGVVLDGLAQGVH